MPTDTRSEAVSRPPAEDGEAEREEWIAAVGQVISDAETWATEQHWFVHHGPKTITEDRIGSREVPVLLIQAPAGRFVIDPIARDVIRALGVIDFCVFTWNDHVMIIGTEAGWQIETNSKTVSRPWSKQTFLEVVSELAGKA